VLHVWSYHVRVGPTWVSLVFALFWFVFFWGVFRTLFPTPHFRAVSTQTRWFVGLSSGWGGSGCTEFDLEWGPSFAWFLTFSLLHAYDLSANEDRAVLCGSMSYCV